MHYFNVTDFGATADVAKPQTKAFQAALDACSQAGGGTVVVPAGHFTIGSIRLFANTTLQLGADSHLLADPDIQAFHSFNQEPPLAYVADPFYQKEWHLPSDYFRALICAYHAENVAIVAAPGATIDGCDRFDPNGEEQFRGPMGIVFSDVKNVSISGYHFVNSANWAHLFANCQNVSMNMVAVSGGHDGVNLQHSQAVSITNCRFETGDDAIAGYDVSDLTVTNTWFNSACNDLRLGGVNLHFEQCDFAGPARYPHRSSGRHNTLNGLLYYSIDADEGKPGEAISFDSCRFDGIDQLMYYRFGQQWALQTHYPLLSLSIKNSLIQNTPKTAYAMGTGEPLTMTLDHVTLKNVPTPFLVTDEAVTLQLIEVDCGEDGVTFENAEGVHFFTGVVSTTL